MNDALWLKLGKTDPAHTKGFKRSGGFSGTALKPMWVWQRLTEEFGPCGTGWGFGEPTFQVVPTATEILVYCTVSAWHGKPENVLFGVGGDKALTVNKYGPSSDDEAFKKAFTDALMNAFKFIGVGADIHMGLFDDSKYVATVRKEFEGDTNKTIHQDQADALRVEIEAVGADTAKFLAFFKVAKLEALPASRWNEAVAMLEAKRMKEAA
jgi:hypothetical protein